MCLTHGMLVLHLNHIWICKDQDIIGFTCVVLPETTRTTFATFFGHCENVLEYL